MEYTGNNGGEGAEIRRNLFGGGFGAKTAGTRRTDQVFNRFQHLLKSLLRERCVGLGGVDVTLVLTISNQISTNKTMVLFGRSLNNSDIIILNFIDRGKVKLLTKKSEEQL